MEFYEKKQSGDSVINMDRGDDSIKSGEKNKYIQPNVLYSMKDQVTSFMLQQSKEHAQKAFNIYGNIDILRPYFHVEPRELLTRLLDSLLPKFSSNLKPVLVGELYGPLMLVLTLIALLLFGMKAADHVREGTLMGTAFAVCFGYWLGASCLVYLIAYVCNTQISYLQILSLMGYALFGHCIVLLLGTLIHSHSFFYSIWAFFGGLSALKMVVVMISRTTGYSQRLIISSLVSSLHLLFLLYLHFAYHKTVKVIDSI